MPGVLDRAVDTIAFPDLTGLGWRPLGARRDEIAGRAAVTVYYGRRGREVRYTIVSGSGGVDDAKALGQTVTWGARVWTFVTGVPDTMTLVFKREERTVVLTAPRADATFRRTMLRLASFRAGGRLAA